MSQTTFSETRSLINYMQTVGAPTLNIVKGSNKKDANGVEIPNSASRYVQFMKPNGEQLGRAMLAKKVTDAQGNRAVIEESGCLSDSLEGLALAGEISFEILKVNHRKGE